MNNEAFFQAYATCALWSSSDEINGKDVNLDTLGREKLAPGVLEDMRAECDAFIAANTADLEQLDPEQAGHDFWLTRNGHGAGYWNRGNGEVGERLSKACGWRTKFPERSLYIGDDGLIYQA